MATTSGSKLRMKLFIDSKARKVLFAEAQSDCVDFLFNVLSLHVGTVVKLLKQKGMNGCLPNLYDSLEDLDGSYIQLNKDKDILLKPKCSVGISPVPYLLNGVTVRKTFYGCANNCTYDYKYWDNRLDIKRKTMNCVSDGPNAFCQTCNKRMSEELKYVAPLKEPEKGFVKEALACLVMDDLVLKPLSINSINELLIQFNLNGTGELQEQVVNIGMEEALMLLKASFESKTVLTSVFLTRVKEEKIDTQT